MIRKHVNSTNQKGQMPPQHLFTLTRGIQIGRQPKKIYKKKILKKKSNFFQFFFYIKQFFSADAKLFSKKI
jgi:hypothetical protein